MDALLRQPGTDPDRIAVIGQSLGAALALTAMAASPMKDRLRAAGTTESQLARIHAPVGLDIGAKTPAEIAVSVLAQVTRVLRQG